MARTKRESPETISIPTLRKLARTAVKKSSKKRAFKSVADAEPRALSHPYHYYAQLSLGGTGPTVVDTIFRGNDMYDPEYALGGHQPWGFDQLTPLYRKFYVVKSHIDVQVVNNTNNSSYGQLCVWADTNPVAPTNPAEAVERCIANQGMFPYISSYNAPPTRVRMTRSTKQMLNSGVGEDMNHGTSGASPEEVWYWHVVCTMQDQTLTRVTPLIVDLKYDCLWTESALSTTS